MKKIGAFGHLSARQFANPEYVSGDETWMELPFPRLCSGVTFGRQIASPRLTVPGGFS